MKRTLKTAPVSAYDALPFFASKRPTKAHPGHRNFWSVKATGDYNTDCLTGQSYAVQFLTAEEDSDGTLLQCVAEHMPREFTGVEIGFMQIIGFAAQAGARRGQEIAAYWERADVERRSKRAERASCKAAK